MSEPPESPRPWQPNRPSLVVLLAMAVTSLAIAVPAYLRGVSNENQRRFLKNYRLPEWSESYTNWTMTYALTSSEPNDVVILGDSSCVVSVDPRRFTERTGLTAYNLGGPGFLGFEGFHLTLRRYLEHHPAPRFLLICVHPTAFDSESLEALWTELRERYFWSYGEGDEAERPHHDRPFFYYMKEGIRTTYGDMMGGLDYYTNALPGYKSGKSYNALLRENRALRGHFENPAILTADEASRAFKLQRLDVSRKCAANFRALVRLAKEHGMRVLVRTTPLLAGTQPKSAEPLGSWLMQLEREEPHVVVSRPVLVIYEPPLFGESRHCNQEGAERFTAFVADEAIERLHLRKDDTRARQARNP